MGSYLHSLYKCLIVLQKKLKKMAKAATKNNSAPNLLMINKLIDDLSRSRELDVSIASDHYIFYLECNDESTRSFT